MGWKDENQQRLDGLDTMSPSQLATLEAELVSEFDKMDSDNATLQDLNDVSVAIQNVREAKDGRTTELDAIRAQVHPAEDTNEPSDDTSDDADDDTSDDDVDDTADTTGDQEPVGAASKGLAIRRPALTQMARSAVPKRTGGLRVSTRLIAAGDVPGFGVGQEITSSEQLAQAMIRKMQALGRGGTPDDVLVASLVKEYPASRQLRDEDATYNNALMAAATNPAALVAYGGICEPVAVDYTINTIGSTARPLRDGLPSFGASRGGVKFTPPPVLSSITPPVPWTVQDDVAGTGTKPCMKIACGTPQEAVVYAIPVCVEVSNFMGRFSPEMVNAQIALLDVAAARVAELSLLQQIDAGSVATTFAGTQGASRDTLVALDQLIASYEYRYRLDEGATLRVALPDWVRDMIRADRTKEFVGDPDSRATTDAQINQWLAARQIVNPIWLMDDLTVNWPAQAAGALNPWPATFPMYLFAEGTWQFLDGGTLDLGVVRDSTLNATNDYQIWREDFEGLAKRGIESIKVTVTTGVEGCSGCTPGP